MRTIRYFLQHIAHRRLLGIWVMSGLLFFLSGSPAHAENSDALIRSIQELRNGGPVYPAQTEKVPWNGVRWATDTLEYLHAPIRRALEDITDVDITGAGREQLIDSAVEEWSRGGVSNDEIRFQQLIAPATFYGWDGTTDSQLVPQGEVAGASIDAQGRVLQAQTSAGNAKIQSWQDFQENFIPITKNPHGRGAVARLELLARAQNVGAALEGAAPPGDTLPEFYDERKFGPGFTGPTTFTGDVNTAPGVPTTAGVSTERGGRVLQAAAAQPATRSNLNKILRSSGFTQEELRGVQDSRYQQVYSLPYAHNPVSKTAPDQQLPSVLAGADRLRSVGSVAFGDGTENSEGGSGRANELAGKTPPGTPFSQSIIQQAVLDQTAARTAALAQNRLNTLANANNFFGPTAAGLSDIFGQDAFSDLANNVFGGPGGGAGGPQNLDDVPTTDTPPTGTCANQTSNISATEAKGVAVLLGLPPSTDPASPWITNYVQAQTVYGVTGIDAATNRRTTLGPTDFSPPESCMWVVTASIPGETTEAAFIEDVRGGQGTQHRLINPQ